jgi:hypothetical protein
MTLSKRPSRIGRVASPMQYQSKPLKSYAVFRLSLWLTPLLILGACTPEAGRVTTILVDAPATLTAGAGSGWPERYLCPAGRWGCP